MSFDGDIDSLFQSWSAELGELYAAWNQTNVQFGATARPGSPAARDDRELESRSPKPYKPEGLGAGIDAVQMIDAAAQHLKGLHTLVNSRTMDLAPWPITRAICEHVGHAVWLLEPDITPEARMARRWMARLAGAQRLRFLAKYGTKKEEKAAVRLRNSIKNELALRFPDHDLDWNEPDVPPPWDIAGQSYPGLRQQTMLLSTVGATNVKSLYDTLSLSSHPNVITLSMAVESVDAGGYRMMRYRTDPETWGATVQLASDLLYVAANAACELPPRPDQPPHRLIRPVPHPGPGRRCHDGHIQRDRLGTPPPPTPAGPESAATRARLSRPYHAHGKRPVVPNARTTGRFSG
ncbi:hypothetical protein ACRS5S_16705 [Nocardia asiatica]|uniref:hypothetical protein n=1 Tax=Nocardia asiatica TaxID=209252 RepID=UPI003EDE8BE5